MGWQKRMQTCSLSPKLAEEIVKSAEEHAADDTYIEYEFVHAGENFVACLSGALYLPAKKALLVADLHLEKGSAFARLGQFLPPYDTQRTLTQLAADIEHFAPQTVICLGDSFHDTEGPQRMNAHVAKTLLQMTGQRQWIWITGNHDPVVSGAMGGEVRDIVTLDAPGKAITLCHEPQGSLEAGQATAAGLEICGHLHPVARIPRFGRGAAQKMLSAFQRQDHHARLWSLYWWT